MKARWRDRAVHGMNRAMMIAASPYARGFPIDGFMADLAMRLKRREIAIAVTAELAVLIAVREDMLPAWRNFAGEHWSELPTDFDAILARTAAHTRVAG